MFSKVAKREVARMRYNRLAQEYGGESPCALAAKGRLNFYTGDEPADLVEAVAFTRMLTPGFMNRSWRKRT
jgi:hypothetical protein